MKHWEYHLVMQASIKNATMDSVEEFLNGLGEDGWELCGIDYGCFILKREKLDE